MRRDKPPHLLVNVKLYLTKKFNFIKVRIPFHYDCSAICLNES